MFGGSLSARPLVRPSARRPSVRLPVRPFALPSVRPPSRPPARPPVHPPPVRPLSRSTALAFARLQKAAASATWHVHTSSNITIERVFACIKASGDGRTDRVDSVEEWQIKRPTKGEHRVETLTNAAIKTNNNRSLDITAFKRSVTCIMHEAGVYTRSETYDY